MNKLTKRLLALMLSALIAMSSMSVAFANDGEVVDDTTTSAGEVVDGETTDGEEPSVEEPEAPSEEEPEITSDSLLFGKPYKHNVETWHTVYTATDAGFLTDGKYTTGSWYDKEDVEYFAAKQPDVEIVFDFEGTVEFEEVFIAFMEDTGAGIHRPYTLSIYAINGEEETLIYDAKVPALRFSAVSDAPITADGLKVVTSGSTYTFIDEVEVYAEAKNDGYEMSTTTAPIVNYAEGLAYTIEGVSAWYNGNTNDSAATRLTDGKISWGTGYNSTANFGANSSTAPVVTFNFDEVKEIAEIDIYAIYGKDGIGAPSVVIEYADGENWVKVADISSLVTKNFILAKETIETTALRFTFNTGFLFLGEIQVFDRVTNMAATGYMLQNDNLLLGKSYTHNVTAFNGASKDAGNALTDGVKGGNWYGSDYLNAKQTEVEIVFPLDKTTAVSELFMQFYSGDSGIELPKLAVVYVQKADDSWTKIYEGPVAANNFRIGAEEGFEAKSIKLYFESSQFCFIKEVEAYKHLTGNALNGALEVVPDNFNILLGKTYTHDVTAWYGGSERDTEKTRLTDEVITTSYKSAAFNPQQAEATVEFALDEATDISEIVINTAYGSDGVAAPNVLVSVKESDDAEWVDVYNGATVYNTILKAEETFTAKYLKFKFFGGTSYKFISEIQAYSLPRKAYEATGTMAPIQYSLIKGLTPEHDITTFAYGGSSNVATWTDATVYGDGVSYKNIPAFSTSPATITYLKDAMTFKEVSISANYPTDEILGGVTGIGSIVVEALIDGEWVMVARKADYGFAGAARTYAFGAEEAMTADGVRFTLTRYEGEDAIGWSGIAISEISVFAEPEATEYDGALAVIIPAEAEVPTVSINGGIEEETIAYGYYSLVADASVSDGGTLSYQWYKGDSETVLSTNYYYTMWGGANAGTYKVVVTNTLETGETATAEASIVLNENFYLKNIAVGKSYEWVDGMWGAYPDAGTELTNGVLSSWRYHTNEEYAGAANPEIILDLGAVEEIYGAATAFMSTGASGLALPSSVKYQYSTDKETWYDLGAEWIGGDVTVKDALMITSAYVAEPVEAQYIKMNATGSWVFLGEFMAYAEVIEAVAPVISADLEEAAEAEGEVTLTVEASTTDAGELSYQWYKDDEAIEGATEATYVATASGTYKVVVTNTLEGTTATAESTACVVTITAPEVAGYAVTVSLTKSGSTADATVELIADGATVATATIAGKTGSCAFADVAPGAYTVKVSKTKHADREYAIEVVDAEVAQSAELWLYGDVNGDTNINAQDVLQINRKIANMTSVFNQTANADYRLKVANITKFTTKDDLINAADVLQINRKVANQTSAFDSKVP